MTKKAKTKAVAKSGTLSEKGPKKGKTVEAQPEVKSDGRKPRTKPKPSAAPTSAQDGVEPVVVPQAKSPGELATEVATADDPGARQDKTDPASGAEGAPVSPTNSDSAASSAAPTEPSGSAPASEGRPARAPQADTRLPTPGTVLQKRDRQGLLRCECVVEAEGVRYKGALYRSLSAAALAAARDLGLKAESANGFTFWGLAKPQRPRVETDPTAKLSKCWEAYALHLETALEKAAPGEPRAALLGAVERQARILMNLHAEAKEPSSAVVS